MARISTLPLLQAPTGAETVVVLDGDVTKRSPLAPIAAAACAPSVQQARDIVEPFADAVNATASLQAALSIAPGAGLPGLSGGLVAAKRSVLLDFVASLYRYAGRNYAALAKLPSFTLTRPTTAYSRTAAGVFVLTPANMLRVTDRGAMIEAAATNVSPAPSEFTGWQNSPAGYPMTRTPGAIPAADAAGVMTGTRFVSAHASADNVAKKLPILTAGSWVVSYVIAKGTSSRSFFQAASNAAASGFPLGQLLWDIDLSQSPPTVTPRAGFGAGINGVSGGAVQLANGLVRVFFVIPVSGSPTAGASISFYNATSTGASASLAVGQTFLTLYHEQIEQGSSPTSPILGAGATRAADAAVLTLPTGAGADQIILHGDVERTTIRSNLVDQTKVDLVNDLGASGLVTSLSLIPAYEAALLGPTSDTGAKPYLTAVAGTFSWRGDLYATEADMLAAMGATMSGTMLVARDYVSPTAVSVIPALDFTGNVQGFSSAAGDAVVGTDGGYLTISTAGANAVQAASRSFRVQPGRAYRLSAIGRTANGGGLSLATGDYSRSFGAGQSSSLAGSADHLVSVTGSVGYASTLYVGAFGVSTNAKVYLKNLSLVPVAPAADWPIGPLMIELETAIPARPSATVILAQLDAGSDTDRLTIELRTNGEVHCVHQIDGVAQPGFIADINLGVVADGSAPRIVAGRSTTATVAAMAGTGAQIDATIGAGFSRLRVNRSYVTGFRVFDGLETLSWMKRRTAGAGAIDTRRLWIDGDSYSSLAIFGIALHLADLGYPIACTGVGGSSFAEQYARVTDAATLAELGRHTFIWYDGSPNGHSGGQTDDEFNKFADVVAKIGHQRFLYVRSGQIGAARGTDLSGPRTGENSDMDVLYRRIAQRFGAVHVFDPLPSLAPLAIGDPANAGFAADQSDLAAGVFPRSLYGSDPHLNATALRAISAGVARAVEIVRKI